MIRENYVFTIGFDGDHAIVDKRMRNRFRKLNTRQLADSGLIAAAYRSAVYDKDSESAEYVLAKFNEASVVTYKEPSDLEKVFGIQPPSADKERFRLV